MQVARVRRLTEQIWGVIDPAAPQAKFWLDVLGTDAVRLESNRIEPCPVATSPVYRIPLNSLDRSQLKRLCRTISRGGISRLRLFSAVILWGGLPIPASLVFVCHDPADGRSFFDNQPARLSLFAGRS